MPSLQFVITNRLSLISHLNSNDRSIPLSFPVQFLTLLQCVSRKLTSKRCFDKKMGVKNKTWFLGWRKFPTHRLLLLSFPLLKIQQQEKRKIMEWRQRRSWGSFNFLIDWRKSPACWPAGDKNKGDLWCYHCFFNLFCPLYN